ncbi:MAG: nucleoside deaminase [Pseudomonadota bacterium]
MTFDDECMRQALEQAMNAAAHNEVPVGAVIVNRLDREIIARAYNKVETENNAIAHAEILAINTACRMLNTKNLAECDLYVTLEPCAMCSAAISHSRIGRVFYGASDPKMGAVENGVRFFTNHTCHHRPEIYVGMMAEESEVLLKNFFKGLR